MGRFDRRRLHRVAAAQLEEHAAQAVDLAALDQLDGLEATEGVVGLVEPGRQRGGLYRSLQLGTQAQGSPRPLRWSRF